MKYWLFQNNQVVGPYEREQLASTPGFSAESLVCPEGRKGTQMGDWQRAGVVAELAETLLKLTSVPAGAASGSSQEPAGGLLPPEPTLKDLAVLGTLQEKVGLLENSVGQLQEELRARDKEIAALKVGLSQKSQEAAALQSRLTDLGTQVSAASGLSSELSQARQTQGEQEKTLASLRSRLDSLTSELTALKSAQTELRQLQEKPAPAQPSVQAAPSFPTQAPPPALESLMVHPPVPTPIPVPMPAATPIPSAPITEPIPLIPKPSPFPIETPSGPAKFKPTEEISFEDLTENTPKKKGKKGVWIMLSLFAFSALVGAAYYQGFFAPPAPAEKKTAAQSAAGAPTPNPQQGVPDRTQEAIDFAKSYPTGSGATLSAALEGNNPPPGLSPWMVEKLEGDKYRVNFYAPDSKKPKYQFLVDLSARQLRGLDDASSAVLAAPAIPAAAQPAAPKHRKRRYHRRSAQTDSPLSSALDSTPTRAPKHKARKKRAKTPASSSSAESGAAAQSGETVLPPDQSAASSPKASPKGQESDSLEDLLVPGVPKQR